MSHTPDPRGRSSSCGSSRMLLPSTIPITTLSIDPASRVGCRSPVITLVHLNMTCILVSRQTGLLLTASCCSLQMSCSATDDEEGGIRHDHEWRGLGTDLQESLLACSHVLGAKGPETSLHWPSEHEDVKEVCCRGKGHAVPWRCLQHHLCAGCLGLANIPRSRLLCRVQNLVKAALLDGSLWR